MAACLEPGIPLPCLASASSSSSWILPLVSRAAQCAFELNMQLGNLLKIIFINLVIYAQDQTFN